jgi:hypothetical protein
LFPIVKVAPGVTKNRPPSGAAPLFETKVSDNGRTTWLANSWYHPLELHGNTSINPFFYGTYLAETKPGEPVTRSKKQAFQADAVGAAHQLTPAHFNIVHTFRVEWQPGPGGRLDWFSKGHRFNSTFSMEGDGMGDDWVHAYGIKDEVLKSLTGSQIPIEASYLIFNVAVSSTWGFPYDTPESCEKCYDCDDPKCACTFAPGFCKMLRDTDVAMLIDSVRVYQSRDPSAHVGANHTIGCDPIQYPTRDWIKGHSYRYMRNAPFSYEDKGLPLQKVQNGGGKCYQDKECGGHLRNTNLTDLYESRKSSRSLSTKPELGRGKCIPYSQLGGFRFLTGRTDKVCTCNFGYTGPYCLAQQHIDNTESAYEMRRSKSLLRSIPSFHFTPFMILALVVLWAVILVFGCVVVANEKRTKGQQKASTRQQTH